MEEKKTGQPHRSSETSKWSCLWCPLDERGADTTAPWRLSTSNRPGSQEPRLGQGTASRLSRWHEPPQSRRLSARQARNGSRGMSNRQ